VAVGNFALAERVVLEPVARDERAVAVRVQEQLCRLAQAQADAAGGAGDEAIKEFGLLSAEGVNPVPRDGPDLDDLEG